MLLSAEEAQIISAGLQDRDIGPIRHILVDTSEHHRRLLDALSTDGIDTDCNGVIAGRLVSQEEIEAPIELRVAELRVLAAQTAVEWWRSRERERDERIRRLPLTRGRSWACVADRRLERLVFDRTLGRIRRHQLLNLPAVRVLPRTRRHRAGDDLRSRRTAPW